MGYDWDVIVVGGGPAGISAAIRARWIKRYKAVPCSTLLIENASLGGLAGWHGCLLTGPSWKIGGEDIVDHLVKDLRGLSIPVLQERVMRIINRGEIKEVITSDGNVYRCLAAIIATGIKALVNEREYLGRGLEITSMGYEFIVSHLTTLLAKRWEPRLAVVGSPKLANLIPMIRELNAARSPILFIMEEEGETEGDVVRGWIEGYWGDGYIQGINLRTREGRRYIPCGGVLLDFNSYELCPTGRIELGDEVLGSSFIQVDQDMQTPVPGILAAGDVTAGGYNSFSRAVSQGIAAGLSAYRFVYYKKFGTYPPLFAYRPTDFVLYQDFQELPIFGEGLMPKVLVGEEDIRGLLQDGWEWLPEYLHGRSSIGEIAAEREVPLDDLRAVLGQLVGQKAITLHIEVDS